MDAGRFSTLLISPAASCRLASEYPPERVAEHIIAAAADPDALYRVTNADGTPLCVVLRGPEYPQLEDGCSPRRAARSDWSDEQAAGADHRRLRRAVDRIPDSDGFFGSVELFNDFFQPLAVGRRHGREARRRDRRRHRPLREHPRAAGRRARRRGRAVCGVSGAAGEHARVRAIGSPT